MNSTSRGGLYHALNNLLIFTVFVCQGCAAFAIAPLATTVMVGATAGQAFLAYKTFQTSTGGSLQIKFKDVKIPKSDQEAFKAINRLAVLPGNSTNVKIAEKLTRKESLRIITPNQVLNIIREDNRSIDQLTEEETIERLQDWAAKLKADAIIVFEEKVGAGGFNMNFWSFKRGEMKNEIVLKIFCAKTNHFILDQPGEVVFEVGTNNPPQGEIQELVAVSVVDKLMEYLRQS